MTGERFIQILRLGLLASLIFAIGRFIGISEVTHKSTTLKIQAIERGHAEYIDGEWRWKE